MVEEICAEPPDFTAARQRRAAALNPVLTRKKPGIDTQVKDAQLLHTKWARLHGRGEEDVTGGVKSASDPCAMPIVKSVARTLQILEFFDEVRRPATVVTVARALGYPQSSTAALLKSMVALGYLEYDPRGRTFYPTCRVPLVGSWMNPPLFEEGTLGKLMKSVVVRTGHVVVLGARNGDDAQYFQVVKPPESTLHHIALGTRRPLLTSGVGRVLLSTLQDDEVCRLVRRINAYRPAGARPVRMPELMGSLADVRRNGFYISFDRVVQGSGLIAMLLPALCTRQPLALGVAGPSATINDRKHEFIAIMREEMERCFGRYLRATERGEGRMSPSEMSRAS